MLNASNHPRSQSLVVAWLLLLATLAAPLCGGEDEFPAELVRFAPHEGNPYSRPGARALGCEDSGARLDPPRRRPLPSLVHRLRRHREGDKLLGYATSRDGLRWTRHEEPIYQEHWVEDMAVVKHGGTYYMFAEGRGDRAQLLTSRDGLAWQRVGSLDVRQRNGKPIEAGPYGTPTAWREDGVWHLFYERRDAGVWLATSRDMKVWTNVQDEPVLSPGPGAYDRDLIAMNQVVKHGGRYYAYYHGTGTPTTPRQWTTGVAVSTDLVHWKKYPGNPLLPTEANKSSGILVHDGQRYRLYTMHDEVHVHFPRE